jgi:hypothetical protein
MVNNPNNWDMTGMVIETDNNEQYLVRVNGSRRLTIHNRKFLEKASWYTTPISMALAGPYPALPSLLVPPQATTVLPPALSTPPQER